MLTLEQVQVRAGSKCLLNVKRIEAPIGKVTAILGPNGAGKSTALKALSGEKAPCAGQALLDDTPLTKWDAAHLAQRRAVLAQTPVLSFDYRVHEVVALGRQPYSKTETRQQEQQAVWNALRQVGCTDFADRSYLTLSGGERQRIQFARALAQAAGPAGQARGQYLLLDEPTSAMDLKYQIECLEIARDFAHAGNGVLVILHDLALALEFADDAYLLCGGECLAEGPVEHVLTPENVARAFDLSPERLRFALPATSAAPRLTPVDRAKRSVSSKIAAAE